MTCPVQTISETGARIFRSRVKRFAPISSGTGTFFKISWQTVVAEGCYRRQQNKPRCMGERANTNKNKRNVARHLRGHIDHLSASHGLLCNLRDLERSEEKKKNVRCYPAERSSQCIHREWPSLTLLKSVLGASVEGARRAFAERRLVASLCGMASALSERPRAFRACKCAGYSERGRCLCARCLHLLRVCDI